jgi:predicted glycogen debranching enzyme
VTISFGREILGDLHTASRREWLVTNGLGGYAAGTVAGLNTRRYHGLLVAALAPPLKRTMLLSKLLESVRLEGDDFSYKLACNEYTDDVIDPHGYAYLEAFVLEGMVPVWTYALAETLLEKRVWMAHGSNTTYVTYTLRRGDRPLRLELTPLCTYRDHHEEARGGSWSPGLEPVSDGVLIAFYPGVAHYRLLTDRGGITLKGDWHWGFKFRQEERRGLADMEDLYAVGTFHADLGPGETLTFVATTEEKVSLDGPALLAEEMARQQALLAQGDVEQEPEWIRQLVLAADQFVVASQAGPDGGRSTAASDDGGEGRAIIAGYPWFGVWGRDALIALPGLTLATGRSDDAASILRTFARHVEQGLIPNNFSDGSGEPSYNSADAALWYFQAVGQYLEGNRAPALLGELYPLLKQIIEAHVAGTRHNIHVDDDGLLWAGEPGLALTWMDARLGDWVVTPRTGKPVELNALWINALYWMERFAYLIAGEGLGDSPQRLSPGAVEKGEMLPQVMKAIIDALAPEELHLLQTRPDLQDNPPESWEELGERLGLGAGRMSEITARAMNNLGWAEAPDTLDDGKEYADMVAKATASFRQRFWYEQGGYLYDVVDGPDGDDSSLRPNQILAVSLPGSPLTPDQQRAVVDVVARHLLTSGGLRSLAPGEQMYHRRYEGDRRARDAVYHQGTVWAWLIGPFVTAHYRVYGDAELARHYLQPFAHHLADAGLGTISEIFDGDPPFTPKGCIAQAWSVAEVLRAWRKVGGVSKI